MDLLIPRSNRGGIPNIQTTNVTVNTANVVFSFAPHRYVNEFFQGIIAVKINNAIPDDATDTLPIVFETVGIAGSTVNLKILGGEDATVADITGTGVYLVFYDRATNILQLL